MANGQSHCEHRAAGIDEYRWPPEIRTEQVVGRQALFGRVIERVENVQEQLDASRRQCDRARDPHVEERLRRESPRAARLERIALVALRQRNLRGGGPGFAGEVLQVRGDDDTRIEAREAAHHAQHVWPIVRQPATGVGQVVRILPEREDTGRRRSC